jgi:cyclopropane fatty-acyl-phospholipid synthase-like methyltransferase
MSKEMWNKRYSGNGYVYGTEPNEFFREQLSKLKSGKLLLPAEGEGRNAVYAAEKGWNVSAFDQSETGREKALALASAKNVQIIYSVSALDDVEYPKNSFDVIGLVFAHFPQDKREKYHKKLISFLKPGGTIILEAFSKEQINFESGGPKDTNMLYSATDLRNDFSGFNNLEISTLNNELSEGQYHIGKASVIRLSAIK